MKKIILVVLIIFGFYNNASSQWTVCGEATSNYVNCIISHGSDILIGTLEGVEKSGDQGLTWNVSSTGLPANADVRAFLSYGPNLYAATYGFGIYLSSNNGASWTSVNSGLSNLWVTCMAINGSTLFAGTQGGIYRSTNNGATWSASNSGIVLPVPEILSLGVNSGLVLAGTSAGMYRSVNNGTSWSSSGSGITAPGLYSILTNGANTYVGTSDGVFESNDIGDTWHSFSNGMSASSVIISLSMSGADLIAGSDNGNVYSYPAAGSSWQNLANFTSLKSVFGNGTTVFAAVPYEGLHRYKVCCGWESLNIYSYVKTFASKGGVVLAGTADGVFRSLDSGARWYKSNTGITQNNLSSLVYADSAVFAGTVNSGGVFRSLDNGANWSPVNSGLNSMYINDLLYDGSRLLAATTSGISQTSNAGQSWTNLGTTGLSVPVLKIAVSGTDIFAATNSGVFLSTNNGASWSAVNSGISNLFIRSIFIEGSTILAGTLSGGIFRSVNNGASWVSSNTGLTNNNIRSIMSDGTSMLLATEGGVFRSMDDGQSWAAENSGIFTTDIYALGKNISHVFAGSLGSIFRMQAALSNNPCTRPGGTSVTGITSSTAEINWTSPLLADTFRVRYKPVGGSVYYYKDMNGSGGLSQIVLTNLLPGVQYEYEVSSICAGVSGGYSALATFTTTLSPVNCSVPYSLSVGSLTNVSAILSWTPLVAADTFRIRYTIQGNPNLMYLDRNGSLGTSATLSGLLPGTSYSWQVSSICNGVSSGYSTASTFTTVSAPVACIVPYGLFVSGITNRAGVINWSNTVSADTFRVRYRELSSSTYSYLDLNGAGGLSAATINNLHPNTTYSCQVSSICSGVSSGYSTAINFTTVNTPASCIKPQGVSASNVSNSSALISWSVNVSADTFRVRYAVSGTSTYFYKDVSGGSGNTTTISGLLPGTTYVFRVSSICSGVSSGYSNEGQFTTTNAPVACITPFGLFTNNETATSALLNWSAQVTADSFMIRYSVFGTTNYQWLKISGAGGVSSTLLSGLQPNTTYQWQIRTICSGVSVSIYSTSSQFTTTLLRLASHDMSVDSWKVFPNPFSDKLQLKYRSSAGQVVSINIIDVNGRIVFDDTRMLVQGENEISISGMNLATGIYQLSLKSRDEVFNCRIIKH